MIQILLNGKTQEIPKDISVGEFLRHLQINPQQIAISVNWEVVAHSQFDHTSLSDGDEVEVFHAVGGG